MKNLIFCVFLFLSLNIWAQSNQVQLIKERLFHVEQNLDSTLTNKLRGLFGINKGLVKTELICDFTKKESAKNLNRKFLLPGLDGVVKLKTNLKETDPSEQILTWCNQIKLKIRLEQNIDDSMKRDLQSFLTDELKTLTFEKIRFEYLSSLILKKLTTNEQNSNVSSLNIVIFLVALVLILFLGYLINQSLKAISKASSFNGQKIEQALNSLGNLNGNKSQVTTKQRSPFKGHIEPTSRRESYQNIKEEVQALVGENALSLLIDYVNISDSPQLTFVCLDFFSNKEREKWESLLSNSLLKRYQSFILGLSNKNVDIENYLVQNALKLKSDLQLFIKNPSGLIRQALKNKIESLDDSSRLSLFKKCNKEEFNSFSEMIPLETLAKMVTYNKELLGKLKKAKTELVQQDYKKLNEVFCKYIPHIQDDFIDLSLASYLPFEIETQYLKNQGLQTTYWDKLSHDKKNEIKNYLFHLNLSDLSSLLAMLPEKIAQETIQQLPEIKKMQIQRLGIKISETSFVLKNNFIKDLQLDDIR